MIFENRGLEMELNNRLSRQSVFWVLGVHLHKLVGQSSWALVGQFGHCLDLAASAGESCIDASLQDAVDVEDVKDAGDVEDVPGSVCDHTAVMYLAG